MKYVKYRTQKLMVSFDCGETWENAGEERKGEYLGVYSTAEDCANATIPPYEIEPPQAHQNAKATLVLDDGTDVDLPFVGLIPAGDTGSSSTYWVDDNAFTSFDTSMVYTEWDTETRDYIAQHCIKIILSSQIEYVCHGLLRGEYCTDVYSPNDMLIFDPSMVVANDRRGYYKNLREIVIQNSTKYVSINGHHTQVTKIWIPQEIEHLELYDFVYIDNELTIPDSFSGASGAVVDCYYYNGIMSNTVKKLVSYTDSVPNPGGSWSSYGTIPDTSLLYNGTIPEGNIVELPKFTYVRDELVTNWYSAYLRGQNWDSTRRYYVPFFPLSYYKTDFRNPNDNEKFVARLSDGTLYSVPIGDGIVSSGDVVGIQSKICDIKFGSAVIAIGNGVFGNGIIEDSSNPRHNINLIEINSDIDLTNCNVLYIGINNVKLNGNDFFTTFQTVGFYPNIIGNIYVPDIALEAYVKSLPLKYNNSSTVTDAIRLKLRPMSSFKINE